jgi:Zn-dependent protease with chaperone function
MTMRCPSCGTELPVLEGYITWCHECGWNVKPPETTGGGGPLDRLGARLGRRYGRRLAEEVARAPTLEPRLTVSKAFAYVIAGAVHALTIALVAGGVVLILVADGNIPPILAGVLAIALGVAARPRFPKAPSGVALPRDEALTLYALSDDIAGALQTASCDAVVVTADFNASWTAAGIGRRRVMTLGLPLVSVLEPQELVALIAHEHAHARNGDATRGLVVGTAVNGLATLYGILDPRAGESHLAYGDLGVFDWITSGLMWLLSRPLRWLLMLETLLLLRDRQRAEYLADALEAGVAGTDASMALHEKLLLASAFDAALHRRAHRRVGPGQDVFDEARSAIRDVPERERERRRRVARLQDTRLADTHPPTAKRMELLHARSRAEPRVVLDPGRYAALMEELAPLRVRIEAFLVDVYRDSLYAGAR